jgi:hypothetical protein
MNQLVVDSEFFRASEEPGNFTIIMKSWKPQEVLQVTRPVVERVSEIPVQGSAVTQAVDTGQRGPCWALSSQCSINALLEEESAAPGLGLDIYGY